MANILGVVDETAETQAYSFLDKGFGSWYYKIVCLCANLLFHSWRLL